jgi:uncharacterized protein
LPIIIEVVEYTVKIEKILPGLDEMIDGGMITLKKTHAILYRTRKDVKQ